MTDKMVNFLSYEIPHSCINLVMALITQFSVLEIKAIKVSLWSELGYI